MHISYQQLETLNWLPETEKFSQYVNSTVLKYFHDQGRNLLEQNFRKSFEK